MEENIEKFHHNSKTINGKDYANLFNSLIKNHKGISYCPILKGGTFKIQLPNNTILCIDFSYLNGNLECIDIHKSKDANIFSNGENESKGIEFYHTPYKKIRKSGKKTRLNKINTILMRI